MRTFLVLHPDTVGAEILKVIDKSVEGEVHELVLRYPIGILRKVADEVGWDEALAEVEYL